MNTKLKFDSIFKIKGSVNVEHLTLSENTALQNLLCKFLEHFIKGVPKGIITTDQLEIRLKSKQHIFYKPYRLAYSDCRIVALIIAGIRSSSKYRRFSLS